MLRTFPTSSRSFKSARLALNKDPAHWSPVARVVASQIPRSISASEKNHGLRYGGSSKSICKEIALQGPKTGKFDYFSWLNHPAHSMAFKFFTDDLVTEGTCILDTNTWGDPRLASDALPSPCLNLNTNSGQSRDGQRQLTLIQYPEGNSI